jgi:two-component system alkaline phosphatase synthesis response regulator PhoP
MALNMALNMAKKILLVEDEKMLAEMYRDKLLKEGFDVVLSLDAEGGFELAKKEKPDLVVLDILLPRGNGISFLEKLREDPETAFIPVVAFSNYDGVETKKRAFELGILDYLIKANYTPQQLIEKVKGYLK